MRYEGRSWTCTSRKSGCHAKVRYNDSQLVRRNNFTHDLFDLGDEFIGRFDPRSRRRFQLMTNCPGRFEENTTWPISGYSARLSRKMPVMPEHRRERPNQCQVERAFVRSSIC